MYLDLLKMYRTCRIYSRWTTVWSDRHRRTRRKTVTRTLCPVSVSTHPEALVKCRKEPVFMFVSSSWHYTSDPGWRRRLHQRQFHQDAREGRELPVHRMPGSTPHNTGRFLADGLGAEVQCDRHDDPGSGRWKGEMSAVLARHAAYATDGRRQAAGHAGQRSTSGQLHHPSYRGQGRPGTAMMYSVKKNSDLIISLDSVYFFFSFRRTKSRESRTWTTRAGPITARPCSPNSSSPSFPTWDTSTNQGPSSPTAAPGLADQERSSA